MANSSSVQLDYGSTGRFSYEIDAERLIAYHCAPTPADNFHDDLRASLERPLDFPPMEQAIVPGDRVTLALDRHTPEAAAIVAEVWKTLEKRDVSPDDVVVLQPASLTPRQLVDPRSELPESIRQRVGWKIHDPTDESNRSYLASTVSGDRVYLARDIVDADFVISIGSIGFDPVLGYRGTNSVFYPGLSSTEAVSRAHGQGHRELDPDDQRPLRQVIDEIAWLLGVQFSIQVIPAAGCRAGAVISGASDSVFRRGKALLNERWRVALDSRPEIVVAAIETDAAGHGWEQVGAALATAQSLVARGGKILLLTELEAELGPGMQLVRESQSPRDAIKPLRLQSPPDLIAATQLATAVDWADVYLLSHLRGDLVEDLFIIPLDTPREAERLLASTPGACVFLAAAQNTYGQISRH